jgi:Tfp pilus assembly protein PilV
MNLTGFKNTCRRGSALIEVVIAAGVLAVAIPLVFGALAESGKSSMSSGVETRSTWMVPACLEEIRASREGRPRFFTATATGQVFPAAGDVWALAFSPEGKPLGKVSKAEYDKGAKMLNGAKIQYLASISSASPSVATGPVPMLRARVSLEYPAGAPAEKRRKIDFFTRIP